MFSLLQLPIFYTEPTNVYRTGTLLVHRNVMEGRGTLTNKQSKKQRYGSVTFWYGSVSADP